MNGARLYGRYVAASLRAQMQYPASFIATNVGVFAATVIDFIGIWALFARFRQIEAWRFEEVALFYGVVSVSFAIADAITRGFDIFGERFVKTGDFDRLLVRPRSTVLQLLGYELRATRIGRLAQGMLAWGVAVHLCEHRLDLAELGDSLLRCRRWRRTVLGDPRAPGDARLLDRRESGSREHADVRRRGSGAIPARHLHALVPRLPHLRRPTRLRLVLPRRCRAGTREPHRRSRVAAAFHAGGRVPLLAGSLWVWRFGVRRYTSTGS